MGNPWAWARIHPTAQDTSWPCHPALSLCAWVALGAAIHSRREHRWDFMSPNQGASASALVPLCMLTLSHPHSCPTGTPQPSTPVPPEPPAAQNSRPTGTSVPHESPIPAPLPLCHSTTHHPVPPAPPAQHPCPTDPPSPSLPPHFAHPPAPALLPADTRWCHRLRHDPSGDREGTAAQKGVAKGGGGRGAGWVWGSQPT